MSLDMTASPREAALDSAQEQIDEEAAPAAPPWLQDLILVSATALGVTISSSLAVLLFLR